MARVMNIRSMTVLSKGKQVGKGSEQNRVLGLVAEQFSKPCQDVMLLGRETNGSSDPSD